MDMKQRIVYIDQLKGLAILLVVMGHVCSKSFMIDNTEFNYFYSSFHMPLFMFLSGLFAYKGLIHWNMAEACVFLKKKTLRIIVPFVIWGGCLSLATHGRLTDIYIGTNASLWFLPALFYSMIWGFIANKLAFSIKVNSPLLADVIVNILLYILLLIGYRYGILHKIPFALSFIKLYPFFIIGAWMSRYSWVKKLIIESDLTYFISIIAFIICWIYRDTLPQQVRLTGMFAIVILMNFFKSIEQDIPHAFTVAGKYSLEIYLFHWFLLPSLDIVSNWYYGNVHLNIDISYGFLLLAVSSFIVAVPIITLSILFAKIIQQNKYMRLVGFGNLK